MMKKKCVALLLVFALCLSLMPAAFAVDTGVTDSAFNDFAPIAVLITSVMGILPRPHMVRSNLMKQQQPQQIKAICSI